MRITVLTFLALLMSNPAFARPAPAWCQDLGVAFCGVDRSAPEADRAAAHSLLSALAGAEPSEFLPADLALNVSFCEASRSQGTFGASVYSQHCGPRGELPNLLRSVMIIPENQARAARMPPSGIRVVTDCFGSHLQVTAGSDLAAFKRRLKQAFSRIEDAVLVTRFRRNETSHGAGIVSVCELPENGRAIHRRRDVTVSISNGSGSYTNADDIPPDAYITPRCLAPPQVVRRPVEVDGETRRMRTMMAEMVERQSSHRQGVHSYAARCLGPGQDPSSDECGQLRFGISQAAFEVYTVSDIHDRPRLQRLFSENGNPNSEFYHSMRLMTYGIPESERRRYAQEAFSWCTQNICDCRFGTLGALGVNDQISAVQRTELQAMESREEQVRGASFRQNCPSQMDMYSTGTGFFAGNMGVADFNGNSSTADTSGMCPNCGMF